MLTRWLVAAVLALVLPLAGLAAVTALEASLESGWRDALEAEYGPIPADAGEEITLAALCIDPEFLVDGSGACGDTSLLGALRTVAIASVVVGGVVLLVAGGTALVTTGNRRRMALLFRPALVVVLLGTALLLVLQAILVIGVLWEVMTVWIGWIWPWLLLVLGITALGAVIGVLGAIAEMLSGHEVTVPGLVLRRTAHPRLYDEVDRLAADLGTDPPAQIAVGLEPNFFVVDAPVQSMDGRHEGRTLYVSSPVCAMLTRDEFRAVVGHELGHFRGEDTAYTKRISPLYAAGRASLGSLAGARSHWSGVIAMPATALLSAVFDTLASSVAAVSRDRELEADRAGAEAASPDDLGSALRKLHVVAPAWPETMARAVRAASAGRPITDVAIAFAGDARGGAAQAEPEAVRGGMAHPFDSHPPLAERLAALGMNPVATGPLDLDPDEPASDLIGDATGLNQRLSELLTRMVLGSTPVAAMGHFDGPSKKLREAAVNDTGIAAVLATMIESRGPDLVPPTTASGRWTTIADLLLVALPEADRGGFLWGVGPSELPGDGVHVVVDIATPGDPTDRVLPKGSLLREVGQTSAARHDRGMDETAFVASSGDEGGERVVVLHHPGSGPIRCQAAGLLVVPSSHILTATSGPIAEEVAAVTAALAGTRRPGNGA